MSEIEKAKQNFHNGSNYKAYEYLGAHKATDKNGLTYTVFRTWAPNADAVFVTGDFNNWSEKCPMKRVTEKGIWEAKVRLDFKNEDKLKYKYLIMNGEKAVFKADPYGFHAGTHEETSTYLYELPDFTWTDSGFLNLRKKEMYPTETKPAYSTPINIYEVHAGSFMRKSGGSYLSYRELADRLGPYVKRMGYTHVELLPIAEHPLDESWGYQICGFFAPTSRFGTPEDLMYFVNKLHSYGIGVLLDWVPAHFSKDEHGLSDFDGGCCYEYRAKDKKEHKVWGTRFFDLGRPEVRSFLISNALYWLGEYHIDGLRVDAVASMLYLDFDRQPGEWTPAHDGTNKNYDAIDFIKKLNCKVFENFGDALMIAEESSAWPMVTKPVYLGGLGFSFKWNMGFMNDMMQYISADPLFRGKMHKCITFSLMYSFSENFILAVSHDEVVHGKKSLLDKNFGDYEQKFAGMRCFMTYMMCHPGKKLTFMGTEYGQFREWDCTTQLEWFMTGYERHADLLRFTSSLNHFYLDTPALWERDLSWDGFKWVKADEAEKNAAVFLRYGADGQFVLCAFNFSAVPIRNLRTGVPEPGLYRACFTTAPSPGLPVPAKPVRSDGFDHSVNISLPPLSAAVYKCETL